MSGARDQLARHRSRARYIAAIMVACAATASVAACSHSATAAQPPTIDVSVNRCGQGWTSPKAGQQSFTLHNSDFRAGEVLLTEAGTDAVYADVEPIGPGTTANLSIDLGSGSYTFRCAMEDEGTVTGPAVTIPGHAAGAVPVSAVTQGDLVGVTQAYEKYVRGQLPKLASLTATLGSDMTRGDLAAARTAWLPAHLEYERLGAAYNAFGDLDGDINGLPDGLPEGVNDPGWTGFHRIEYGLWHGQDAEQLVGPTADLEASVKALSGEFAHAQIDPLDVAIRAHEITENALQFELTGQTDFGSHSNLRTARANLDGTLAVLQIIDPVLIPRYAGATALPAQVTQAEHDLDATGYPALDALSVAQRDRIDADFSGLAESLAPVASILEPRRPS